MNINEYINSSPNKAEARRNLAEVLGMKEVTIRAWANGNRHPHRKMWYSIEKATNGKVKVTDLIDSPMLCEE
jgi:DNA-binding transcriptional regulator YdaS (Cro superfamily)